MYLHDSCLEQEKVLVEEKRHLEAKVILVEKPHL